MKSIAARISVCFFLAFLSANAGICQEADRERLAILPFAAENLSPEQGAQLSQSFTKGLAQTVRFNILPDVAMRSMLEEAGVKRTDDCTTLPCLAQLGKILGVDKVVFVDITHAGEAFVAHVQLIDASDASLVYDEKINYEGAFNNLVSDNMPELGRKLGSAKFGTGTRWYVIAGAAVIGVGIMYWIYKTFASTSTTETPSASPIQSPQ